MSPRWVEGAAFLTAALLLTPATPAFATAGLTATTIAAAAMPTKSCSGAFRYAARVGNTDIVEVSYVQAVARDRRLSRNRYTRGSTSDAGTAHLMIAMCGAR